LLLPVLEARSVQVQHAFGSGMKCADVFEVTAITRVAMISNDDTEKRSLFRPMTGKANVNGHTILYYVKARTNQTLAPGSSVASGERKRVRPRLLRRGTYVPAAEEGGNLE